MSIQFTLLGLPHFVSIFIPYTTIFRRQPLTQLGRMSAFGLSTTLTEDQMAALRATANAMSAKGKGFLASDESAGPWLRAGHSECAKIPDTAENRAMYRSTCYTTPGLNQYISGVILHVETLFQSV